MHYPAWVYVEDSWLPTSLCLVCQALARKLLFVKGGYSLLLIMWLSLLTILMPVYALVTAHQSSNSRRDAVSHMYMYVEICLMLLLVAVIIK